MHVSFLAGAAAICLATTLAASPSSADEFMGVSTSDATSPPSSFEHHGKRGLRDVFKSAKEKLFGRPCPFIFEPMSCKRQNASTDPLAGKDVRHLRPEDIKAVMSLGDSVTAGFAMDSWTVPFIPFENRGKVHSSGASDPFTIMGFFKNYNPNIGGGAKGHSIMAVKGKGLNQAVTRANGRDLPEQADKLIRKYREKSSSNDQDWKLLSILIGANDVCSNVCVSRNVTYSADSVDEGVRKALEKIRLAMPRVFVNLLGLFKITVVKKPQEAAYCKFAKKVIGVCHECDMNDEATLDLMDAGVDEFNDRLKKISAEYEGKYKDFGVVYQPAFTDLPVEEYGRSILSRFDCYHPNVCANRYMSVGIWNSMFSDGKEKLLAVENVRNPYVCPDGNDFIR